MNLRVLNLLTVLIFALNIGAEIIILDSKPQNEHDANLPFSYLPSEEEQKIFLQELHNNRSLPTPSAAPPLNVLRPVSEFEQMYGVLVRYPLGIPVELIVEMSKEAKVTTIVASTYLNTVTNLYTQNGAKMDNCDFIIRTTDSYWTRDYGPWFSFSQNGNLNVINFTYNRPRPNDNAFMPYFASHVNLSIYDMGIVHTGGNYMSDGLAIASSAHIAYTENNNNSTLVNQTMKDYLGVQTYHVVQDPTGTYIDHVDCWAKFLSPDTILIRSVPTTHSQYSQIESVANHFANQMSSWGRPFNVVRVYTPNNQPYTNSLILNNRVFVPITGSTNDTAALQVYENAMPGYTIIGVRNNTSNPWESTDALHCRTHELAERNIIFIDHIPLAYTIDYSENINISANITSFTGNALDNNEVRLYYKINRNEFISHAFEHQSSNKYSFNLQNVSPGDTLGYYISAEDLKGNNFKHPFIGAAQAHKVIIKPDTIKPVINHTPITSINFSTTPIEFKAQVSDNTKIDKVYVEYYTNLNSVPVKNEMRHIIDNKYTLTINSITDRFSEYLQEIYYRISAKDIANPSNTSFAPESGWYKIVVRYVEDYTKPEIFHTPIPNITFFDTPIMVSAKVTDNIRVADVSVEFYTNEESGFQLVNMNHDGNDIYSQLIDIVSDKLSTIYYRIIAHDSAYPPNTAIQPETNWFKFDIKEDKTKPLIEHTVISEAKYSELPLVITANVTDDVKLDKVYLEYYSNNELLVSTLEMKLNEVDLFFETINNGSKSLNSIYYRIIANDRAGNFAYSPDLDGSDWHKVAVIKQTSDNDIVIDPKFDVSIYPNPFSISKNKKINVNINSLNDNTINIELFNIKGQKILSTSYPIQKNIVNRFSIDINQQNLTNGVYFMRIGEGNNSEVKKLLIMK